MMKNPKTKNYAEKVDVYQMVTDLIIQKLDQGKIPWKQSWLKSGMPKNYETKRSYTSLNAFLLASYQFENNYFLTFNQVKKLGGTVNPGAKSIPITFWKILNYKEIETNVEVETKIPFLQYYSVFNVKDISGIDFKFEIQLNNNFDTIEECEMLLESIDKPSIEHLGNEAYYQYLQDKIVMPNKNKFNSEEGYYSTLFHEIIHSTGHPSRLNRPIANKFGTQEYSKEELIAEMGASFLCNLTGISNEDLIENQASYIQSWITRLKNDKKLLIQAAGKAQKAVEYLIKVEDLQEEEL